MHLFIESTLILTRFVSLGSSAKSQVPDKFLQPHHLQHLPMGLTERRSLSTVSDMLLQMGTLLLGWQIKSHPCLPLSLLLRTHSNERLWYNILLKRNLHLAPIFPSICDFRVYSCTYTFRSVSSWFLVVRRRCIIIILSTQFPPNKLSPFVQIHSSLAPFPPSFSCNLCLRNGSPTAAFTLLEDSPLFFDLKRSPAAQFCLFSALSFAHSHIP